MRIVCHAQHQSGVGHFVRMHALACALSREHEVHLVDGGRPVPRAPDPASLRLLSLPRMARAGGELVALDGGTPIGALLAERARALARAVGEIRPDAMLVDQYPFSKWELEKEVDAAIDAARRGNPAVRILCSLRDVTPQTRFERVDRDSYAERVLAVLRSRFDGILIHADPRFTRIEEHFPRARDLPLRVAYTGFVIRAPPPPVAAPPPRPYAVVSCGGGSSALAFLRAAIAAFRRLAGEGAGGLRHLVVFAGAFVAPADLQALEAAAERAPIQIRRFGPEFDALLDGGALSVGRAGYNTCAALLRSRTRAVLAPDPVMSDQERRARRFADLGLARIVEGDPPGAEALGAAMRAALAGPPPRHDLDLDGLARTPALVAEWDRA